MRQSSALVLALAAGALMSACVTWSKKDVKTLAEPLEENTPILSVVKSSGEVVRFSKSEPGRIRGYAVVGTTKDPQVQPMDLEGPFSMIKMGRDRRITEVTDGKGRSYAVKKVLSRDENRMTVVASEREQVSVPLAEASVIEVQKHNALTITAILLGGLVVVPALIGILSYSVGLHFH